MSEQSSVFVVLRDYGYEGLAAPLTATYAFLSEDEAKAFAKSKDESHVVVAARIMRFQPASLSPIEKEWR